MRINRGTLFIVSAPSGAGKSTLCKILVEKLPKLGFAVSHTTRAPRDGEQDGTDYHFVDIDTFKSMINKEDFLEWAEVHGNFYGTSKSMLEAKLASGSDILHDIDVQGARQMRDAYKDGAVYVFVLPPTLEALKDRLSGRGTDTQEIIDRRVGNAVGEIRDFSLYDYVILNDTLDEALKEFEAVIQATRVRVERVDHKWVDVNFYRTKEA
jgi:guanylate kinase